jgi:thiol-disulfide isomerase/thioredoxin
LRVHDAAAIRSDDVAARRLPLPLVIAASVVVVAAAAALIVLAPGSSSDGDRAGADGEGERATEATPEDVVDLQMASLVEGRPDVRLGDLLDGRPLVLNLFASWCAPCIAEMPAFEKVHQEMAGQVDFAGLAIRNPPEDALGIVERTGVTYPTFGDDGDLAADLFDVTSMPTTIFISADGEVLDVHARAFDEPQLRDAIEEQFGVAATPA